MEFFLFLEQALMEYSTDDNYSHLIDAKDYYFSKTGKIDEDSEDYESRMNCFNDWFLFQYRIPNNDLTIIEKFLDKKKETSLKFENFNHAIFEFAGKNLKKQYVIKDLLHGKKIVLSKNQRPISLLKGDLFVGRTLQHDEDLLLLSGMCLLPNGVKRILEKESKKVRKLKSIDAEIDFLMQVEALNTKWSHYNHVEIKKIFSFA